MSNRRANAGEGHLDPKQEVVTMIREFDIDLQLFAEGEGASGQPAAGGKPAGEQTPAKTFTQEDVNSLVARESKAAVEKLLKEAGIASEGDYKAAMKAFKDWQDKQKTDLEKATGANTTLQKERDEALSKATALEQQLAAIGKGIPADRAAKYIKLAEAYLTDKNDFAAALDLALKDFPVASAGVAGQGGNPAPGDQQKKNPLPKGVVTF